MNSGFLLPLGARPPEPPGRPVFPAVMSIELFCGLALEGDDLVPKLARLVFMSISPFALLSSARSAARSGQVPAHKQKQFPKSNRSSGDAGLRVDLRLSLRDVGCSSLARRKLISSMDCCSRLETGHRRPPTHRAATATPRPPLTMNARATSTPRDPRLSLRDVHRADLVATVVRIP